MLDRKSWFSLGVVVGVLATMILQFLLIDVEGEVAAPNEAAPVHERLKLGEHPASDEEEIAIDDSPITVASGKEKDASEYVSNIPYVYEGVIGEPRPKRLRFADRHAGFIREERDESWAAAMESGISVFLADSANRSKFVSEHVECRSEHCEIAGYVPSGDKNDIQDIKAGLKTAGWWQGGLSSATTAREIDGVVRVVILFNRTGGWPQNPN